MLYSFSPPQDFWAWCRSPLNIAPPELDTVRENECRATQLEHSLGARSLRAMLRRRGSVTRVDVTFDHPGNGPARRKVGSGSIRLLRQAKYTGDGERNKWWSHGV